MFVVGVLAGTEIEACCGGCLRQGPDDDASRWRGVSGRVAAQE